MKDLKSRAQVPQVCKGSSQKSEVGQVDLDKLERDIEEEGNRVAREKYKIFAGH